MGWFWEQLGLLLRTKLILRSRQPVILALEVLWPLTIFLIVYGVRQAIPPQPQDVCYYNSRVLPSGGAVPMLQSLLCNMENDCLGRSSYEEIPSYPQARVQQIVEQLSPVLSNKEISSVIKALPKGVRLLESIAETVSDPVIQDLLDNGIQVIKFLKNPEETVEILREVLELSSSNVPKALVNSKITVFKLLEVVSSSEEVKSLLCDPDGVGELLSITDLILQNETAEALCHLNSSDVIDLLQKLMDQLNIDSVLELMSGVISSFGRPDVSAMLEDIGSMVQTLYSLPNLLTGYQESPALLNLLSHLKTIAEVFQSETIDLNLLSLILKDLAPIFGNAPLTEALDELLKNIDFSQMGGQPAAITSTPKPEISELPKAKYFTLGSMIQQLLSNKVMKEQLQRKSLQDLYDVALKPQSYKVLRDVSSLRGFQYRICNGTTSLSSLVDLEDEKIEVVRGVDEIQDVICATTFPVTLPVGESLQVKPIIELLNNKSELFTSLKNFGGNNTFTLQQIIRITKAITEAMLSSLNEETPTRETVPHLIKTLLGSMGQLFPLPYSNFSYALVDGLDIVFTLLTRGVNSISEHPSQETWPQLVSTVVGTFSSKKASIPRRCTGLSDLFCDKRLQNELLFPSSKIQYSSLIQSVGCRLFSSIEWNKPYLQRSTLLSKPPPTSDEKLGNATINWGGLAMKSFGFFEAIYRLQEKIPESTLSELSEEVEEIWNNTDTQEKMLAVSRAIEIVTDCVRSQNPPYWNDFMAIFSVADKVVELLNERMSNIINTDSLEVFHLSLESPALSSVIRKIVQLLPDIMNTFADLFTKDLQKVLIEFKDVERLKKIPCNGASVADIIPFKNSQEFRNLESFLCESSQQLLQELLQTPSIGSAASDIGRANKGKRVRMDWVAAAQHLDLLRNQSEILANFSGPRFADIPAFDQAFTHAIKRLKAITLNITSGSKGTARFTGYLVDSVLTAYAEFDDDDSELLFDQQCDFNISKDDNGKPAYAKCIISGYKYAVWAATEVLAKVNGYISWITGSRPSDADEVPLLKDIGGFIEESLSLFRALVETALKASEGNMSLSNFCMDTFLDSLTFPDEKSKEQVRTLQESICSWNENKTSLASPLLNQLSVTKLLNHLNVTWHTRRPSEITTRLSHLVDQSFTFYEYVTTIEEKSNETLKIFQETITNSSAWTNMNKKLNDILNVLIRKSFSNALEALAPTLTEVVKTNPGVAEKLGTASVILEVVNAVYNNDTSSLEMSENMENILDLLDPLQGWIQDYGTEFAGNILYTIVMNGTEFLQLLNSPNPIQKFCSQPTSAILNFLPSSESAENRLEEAKIELCKMQWHTIIENAEVEIQRLNMTTSDQVRRFLSSLGGVMDSFYSIVSSRTESKKFQLEKWNATIHFLKESIEKKNLTLDEPQKWLTPAVIAAVSAVDKDNNMLYIIDNTVNSVNCHLHLLQGGFSWDKVEPAYSRKPYVLALLKVLNNSIEMMNITLETLLQPDKLEAILTLLSSSSNQTEFCNVDDWSYYVEQSNPIRPMLLKSLHHLICKGNATNLLRQLNPERSCLSKKRRESFPAGSFNATGFALHIEQLYSSLSNVFVESYKLHLGQENHSRDIVDVKKWEELFEGFWSRVINRTSPAGIADALLSVYRVVDKVYQNQSNSSPARVGLDFVEKGIVALNIVATPDANSSFANSLTIIKEAFDSAFITSKKPKKGLLETDLQERKLVAAMDYFERHPENLLELCSKSPQTWKKHLASHPLHMYRVMCSYQSREWMGRMKVEFPHRSQLENFRAANNAIDHMMEESDNERLRTAISTGIREAELKSLSSVTFSIARKLANDSDSEEVVQWADWRTLLNSTWQMIPDFLEVLDRQSCSIFARHDVNMLKVSQFFGRVIKRIPDLEFLACDLITRNSTDMYKWFSDTFEMKTVLRILMKKWDDIPLEEDDKCATPYGTAAQGGKLLQVIISRMAIEKNNKKVVDCISNNVNEDLMRNIKGYLTIFNATLAIFDNMNITGGNNSLEAALDVTVKFLTEQLPVYRPITDVLQDPKKFGKFLEDPSLDLTAVEIASVRMMTVDLTWVLRKNFSYPVIWKELCAEENFEKLNKIFIGSKQEENLNVLCQDEILEVLLNSMKTEEIMTEVPELQSDAFARGEWLEHLSQGFQDLMISIYRLISDGSYLERNASEGSFLEMARSNLVAELLQSIRTVLKSAERAFGQSVFVEDLYHVYVGVRGLKSLQQLKVFDLEYKMRDVFHDSSSLVDTLVENFNFSNSTANKLLDASLDMGMLLSKKDSKLSLQDVFCNPDKLKDLLEVDSSLADLNEVSEALCNVSRNKFHKAASQLIQNLAFSKLSSNFGKLAFNSLLGKAHLKETDVKEIVNKLRDAPDTLSHLHSLISNITDFLGEETNQELSKMNSSASGTSLLGSDQSVKLIGRVMCGKPLSIFTSQIKFVEVKNKKPKLDRKEIRQLPSQFCIKGYEQVMKLKGGPILWGYLKPFMKGKILYSPDNSATQLVIKELNKTVEKLTEFVNTLHLWGEGVGGLESLQRHEEEIKVLQRYVQSGKLKPVIEKLLGGDVGDITANVNVSTVMEHVNKISGLLNMMQLVGHITQCMETNRFVGYKSETDLEEAAIDLHQNREFIAAIVFLNLNKPKNSWRHKRDVLTPTFPNQVDYKIRLDVDNVPTTKRLKDKFWEPDPHNNFFEDLRYLRGFVYLQELLDRAILFLQLGRDPPLSPAVHLQQFPYPCYEKDGFGQFFRMVLPVVVVIAWIFFIAFTIQDHVLQRELHLEEMLRVMGLRPVVGWLAWFILAYSILSINIGALIPILKLGEIFPESNWVLISIYLFVYGLSNVMYCYLMSSMFRTAAIASLIGIFAFLASFLPFVVIVTLEWHLTLIEKIAMCLPMSSAFAYGYLYVIRYETQGVGLQWDNMWSSPIAGDTMCFGYVLIMLAVDSLIYFIGGWYIANVWPAGQQAMRQPWYFFCLPTYWGLKKPKHAYFPERSLNMRRQSKLVTENGKSIGVSLTNLHVVYNRNSSYERKAVAGLSLDLLEGEITTLLGKNGAGKTTTINVLIGQYPPTSGAIYVYGKAVPTEYEEARKLLGYCPQYNTLFKFLTVREHLIFYAKLKGLLPTEDEIVKDTENILHSMGLWKLQHEQVGHLSGGLQRRVCVALAFVGGSRLIILDEPTASVDPVARRSIWDLIVKQKSGRTVLLTTHHMDEADILSDKVAILHKGKLLCQGSPMLLKTKHSCGYKLIISRHGPDSDSDNDSGRMSTTSSDSEPCDGKALLEFVRKMIPIANLIEDQGSEVVISIPVLDSLEMPHVFAEFFRTLDSSLQNLGYGSYGLSSATLEEVFLTLCNPEDDVTPQGSPALQHLSMKPRKSLTSDKTFTDTGMTFVDTDSLNSSRQYIFSVPNDVELSGSWVYSGMRLKLEQLGALLTKRFHHTVHNWRTMLCSIIMPCLFIALAMGFSLIRDPQVPDPPLKLVPQMYGPYSSAFFSLPHELSRTPYFNQLIKNTCDNNAALGLDSICPANQTLNGPNLGRATCQHLCRCYGPERQCAASNALSNPPPHIQTDLGVVYNLTDYDVSDYLLDTYCSFVENRFGGWSFHPSATSQEIIKVWYDNSGYHAIAAYASATNNAILKANLKAVGIDPSHYGITTYNHPLHLRVEQLGKETFIQRIADVGIAFTFLMGFTFIPASFVFYIVRERMNEERRLQQVVGVGPFLYWISSLLWDLALLTVAVGVSAAVIAIFQLPVYVSRSNMPAVLLLAFLFGWSMMSLVYLAEKLFKEGTIAFLVIYCVSLFIGINFMVVVVIFGIFPPSQGIVSSLDMAEHIALIFPPYNLLNSLIEVTKNYFLAEIYSWFGQDVYTEPFSMELLGTYFIVMAVEGFIFFILNIIVEHPFNLRGWCKKTTIEDLASSYVPGEDIDVAEERKRVFGLSSQNDILKLMNVKKVFRGMMGKRKAVDNVSLSIPKGECFGLLGVNGAGKTTLFRILTGQIRPTSGEACINGRSITNMLAHSGQSLGYCPQADALDDLLTPVQHLTIYAKLRGVPRHEVPAVVECAIVKFALEMYANQPVGTLSRGNKRKLCTAIAMLGDPEIILLDEPTSGMDPLTRRVVWHNIMQAIKANRSIVLTSHSMEECDILCSRLAIMVNGRLCCLGSPQYLKHRFGQGYTITVHVDNGQARLADMCKFMSSNFPSANLRAHHYNMMEFNVPSKNIPLSVIFDIVEKERENLGILDFSVSQTTLDQVFVSFAQQQSEDAEYDNSSVDKHETHVSCAQYENHAYNATLSDEEPTILAVNDATSVSLSTDQTDFSNDNECEQTRI